MTNDVLSALPTFHLCTFKIHKTVIKQIDKYKKHCLWRGADINAKIPPKASREMVCLPKSEGGLGVLQLETHNDALLLKNFHKFFNNALSGGEIFYVLWTNLKVVLQYEFNQVVLASSGMISGVI
jgi:hypothetical protein